jgi:chromosomal replication initiation ATPase DnaA
MPRQLTFPLDPRPALGRDDFLVSDSNSDAVAWIDRWPDWPGGVRGVSLHGPEASGKSHLAEVWRQRNTAGLVRSADLRVESVPDQLGDAKHLVIDDLEGVVDGEALLHLLNVVSEAGGHVLTLSREAAGRLDLQPPDLRSRLRALAAVSIGSPDDALIIGVMAKMFTDRQLTIDRAVLDYLSLRMQRSFAAARHLVAQMDALSLAEGRRITLPLARRVLDEFDGNKDQIN